MPVRFRCTGCRTLLSIATRKEGASVRCPRCQAVLVVPPTSGDDAANESNSLNLGSPIEKDWKTEPPPDVKRPIPRAIPVVQPHPAPEPDDRDDEPVSHPPPRRRLRVRRPRPINFAESFVWWQRRFHGRTFPFRCPSCGTTVHLRQRVTQTKRTCPGCGFRITMSAIDRQLEGREPERQRILDSSGCATSVLLLAGVSGFIGLSAFWCL